MLVLLSLLILLSNAQQYTCVPYNQRGKFCNQKQIAACEWNGSKNSVPAMCCTRVGSGIDPETCNKGYWQGFVNVGRGRCKVEGTSSRMPAYTNMGNIGMVQCGMKCKRNSDCFGFSVKHRLCHMYTQSSITRGPRWGSGASCYIKVGYGSTGDFGGRRMLNEEISSTEMVQLQGSMETPQESNFGYKESNYGYKGSQEMPKEGGRRLLNEVSPLAEDFLDDLQNPMEMTKEFIFGEEALQEMSKEELELLDASLAHSEEDLVQHAISVMPKEDLANLQASLSADDLARLGLSQSGRRNLQYFRCEALAVSRGRSSSSNLCNQRQIRDCEYEQSRNSASAECCVPQSSNLDPAICTKPYWNGFVKLGRGRCKVKGTSNQMPSYTSLGNIGMVQCGIRCKQNSGCFGFSTKIKLCHIYTQRSIERGSRWGTASCYLKVLN